MLEYLKLVDVGPAPEMEIEFGSRLNFLTGDNGLGKTFLLDIAWWALTRTWARMPAIPHRNGTTKPAITYRYDATTKPFEHTSKFNWSEQEWPPKPGRPPIPGMVIYAQVDGGFSVWDPARNYWKEGSPGGADRPPAFLFRPQEVWDGLPLDAPKKLCRGLIEDWASWQRENGPALAQLTSVLERLSPSEDEKLVPGPLARVALDDVRDHPTLQMPYGQNVALVHSSAGMRRIAALAYLLVWTWQEHVRAAELQKVKPAREIIFLIDEIEAHLHPHWQRRVVPSVLAVMEALTGVHDVPVQLITATHAPLVLASVEPFFSDDDAWFDLDLVSQGKKSKVVLRRRPWVRHGDASSWLTSEAFDLSSTRSVEAERLIDEASRALADESFDQKRAKKLHAELRQVLGDTDPFWMNWRFVGEKRGWLP